MGLPIIRRPMTLHEVAFESGTYTEFGYNLKELFARV